MKAKHKRLLIILICLIAGGLAAALILRNFQSNLVFFYSPTDLLALENNQKTVRLGGLVVNDSIRYEENGAVLLFDITDNANTLTVKYHGLPPALFREGQGMVAKGNLNQDQQLFIATELLAKHDETYMPPEVARALKESGKWKGDAKE